jgi:hypothetical protein
MRDYSELLKKVEEASKIVTDDSLRPIPFKELLRHELLHFKEDTGPQAHAHRKNPPAAIEASGGSDITETLEISPDEPQLPHWSGLGKLDKYLWILEAAHRKGVDGLSATEISKLMYSTFRKSHTAAQVHNLGTRIKKGHVRTMNALRGVPKAPGFQILKGGSDHLKTLTAKKASE